MGLPQVVGAFDVNNNLVAHYIFGNGLLSKVAANNAFSYDADPIGSIVGMATSAGHYVNEYKYLPFGGNLSQTETVHNPFQFVGAAGVTAEGEGLSFMRARCTDASEGRFITMDPIGLGGRDLNLYRYVRNFPTIAIDPTGLLEFDTGKATGAIVEAFIFDAILGLEGPVGWIMGGVTAGLPDPTPPANELSREQAMRFGKEFDKMMRHYGENPDEIFGPSNDDLYTPPVPRGLGEDDQDSHTVNAQDPNGLYGPAGYGAANFVTNLGKTFAYRITYENDAAATAPAQSVTITNNLDAHLDSSTFQLTGIGFGDSNLVIPAGSQHYQTTLAMTYNGQTFNVQMEAGLHSETGQVYASFYSIDPISGLPPANVLTGFLPPENGSGRGQGFISYTVAPKASVVTGTVIPNVASIVFDGNGPVTTDQVDPHDASKGIDTAKQARVTIDASTPSSLIKVLPTYIGSKGFNVFWSGNDNGAGITGFDIYYRKDNGAWTLLFKNAPEGATHWLGEYGHNYGFASVAHDGVGHAESAPSALASAQTTILGPLTSIAKNLQVMGISRVFTVGITGAVPNETVSIQRAPSPKGAWVEIGTSLIAADGTGQYADNNAPVAAAFYRAVRPDTSAPLQAKIQGLSAVGGGLTMVLTITSAVPNEVLAVERASSLNGVWTPLGTLTTGPDGKGTFTDPTATSPASFYRVLRP